MRNEVTILMDSRSQNEAFARVAAAAFVAPLDPTVSELTDIKTAVSEAVTNAIIHGYENGRGQVTLHMTLETAPTGADVTVTVTDEGVGIPDVALARTPLYTSKPELERSGMGFTVMESFMDELEVTSAPGRGTTVVMKKTLPPPESPSSPQSPAPSL